MSCVCPLHTAVSLCKNDWQMGVLARPLLECDNPTGRMYWPNTHFHTYTHTSIQCLTCTWHIHTFTHTLTTFTLLCSPVLLQDLQFRQFLYFSLKLESVLNCTWTRADPCRSLEKWLSKSFQKKNKNPELLTRSGICCRRTDIYLSAGEKPCRAGGTPCLCIRVYFYTRSVWGGG